MDLHDGDGPHRPHARPRPPAWRPTARPTARAGSTVPSASRFTGTDAASGIAGCTTPDLRRARTAPPSADRDVPRRCRPRERAAHGDAALRRHAAADHRRPPGAPARPRRLVHAPGDASPSPPRTRCPASTACPTATSPGPTARWRASRGTCADRAGNVATRAYTCATTRTAPRLRGLAAEPGDGSRAADLARCRPTRGRCASPARPAAAARGAASSCAAGATRSATAACATAAPTPTASPRRRRRQRGDADGPPAPRPGACWRRARDARVRRPPLLRWTAVRGARYYNVQLFRDGRKVLSTWPREPRLRLPSRWRFAGAARDARAGPLQLVRLAGLRRPLPAALRRAPRPAGLRRPGWPRPA